MNKEEIINQIKTKILEKEEAYINATKKISKRDRIDLLLEIVDNIFEKENKNNED